MRLSVVQTVLLFSLPLLIAIRPTEADVPAATRKPEHGEDCSSSPVPLAVIHVLESLFDQNNSTDHSTDLTALSQNGTRVSYDHEYLFVSSLVDSQRSNGECQMAIGDALQADETIQLLDGNNTDETLCFSNGTQASGLVWKCRGGEECCGFACCSPPVPEDELTFGTFMIYFGPVLLFIACLASIQYYCSGENDQSTAHSSDAPSCDGCSCYDLLDCCIRIDCGSLDCSC
ncbi:hypothetical protein M3Y99_01541500 [Aphelenchoides fujianensis]|nr:hypothetical protein M3Y99_01541500 [Aphelenchoides fujianensis]